MLMNGWGGDMRVSVALGDQGTGSCSRAPRRIRRAVTGPESSHIEWVPHWRHDASTPWAIPITVIRSASIYGRYREAVQLNVAEVTAYGGFAALTDEVSGVGWATGLRKASY
jgi:hypothetical protein